MTDVGRERAALRPRDYWLALAVAALAALVYAPGLFYGLPGKAVAGGARIVEGEVPYRDFWSIYAPGMFYACAAVFRLFGFSLMAQAVAALVVDALVVGAAFLLLRRVTGERRVAFLLALALLGAFFDIGREIQGYPPALLLLLGAWHALLSYWERGGRLPLFLAGLAVGLAATFKHDVAAYAVIGAVSSAFATWGLARERRPERWVKPWVATLVLGAGALVTFAPPAAYIALRAGPDAWRDLFVFPATTFAKVMVPSYPPLVPNVDPYVNLLSDPSLGNARRAIGAAEEWLLCTLPQLAFVVALGVVVAKRERLAPATLGTVLMLLVAMPFFWSAAHLQKNTHVVSMALVCLVLAASAWRPLSIARVSARWTRRALALGCVLLAGGLWMRGGLEAGRMLAEWRDEHVLDLPGARGLHVPALVYEAYPPIVAFLQANTEEDERIYVGLARHDAIVINDWALHVVARRRSCTRYGELHRGVADRAEGQREIIADIEGHDVRAIVLWKFGWSDAVLDKRLALHRANIPELGATLLDEYIDAHFDEIARHGEYRVLWRKDAAPPELP